MTLFQIIAILITLATAFSYINYRLIRLSMPIGVMVIALLMSIGSLLKHYSGNRDSPTQAD